MTQEIEAHVDELDELLEDESFTCEHFGCTGMTAFTCVKRLLRMMCPPVCRQGEAVAEQNPDAVVEAEKAVLALSNHEHGQEPMEMFPAGRSAPGTFETFYHKTP